MRVEECKCGAATVIFNDEAYADKTPEEIQRILDDDVAKCCAEIWINSARKKQDGFKRD